MTARSTLPAWLAVGLALVGPGHAAAGDEHQLIVRALAVRQGMVVADVGAGSGEYTGALAGAVGGAGRVYATEVEQRHLDALASRMEREGHRNVIPVLGTDTDTGLPAACCDRLLLRLVYHHFTQPAPMRESLKRALRPGGRVAVIDVPPQKGWPVLPGTPERGGHGIAAEALKAEMTAAGWRLVEEHAQWPGDPGAYCLVFEPAASAR
jgi:protein-L-isoaspartate O-methyltransferase